VWIPLETTLHLGCVVCCDYKEERPIASKKFLRSIRYKGIIFYYFLGSILFYMS